MQTEEKRRNDKGEVVAAYLSACLVLLMEAFSFAEPSHGPTRMRSLRTIATLYRSETTIVLRDHSVSTHTLLSTNRLSTCSVLRQ